MPLAAATVKLARSEGCACVKVPLRINVTMLRQLNSLFTGAVPPPLDLHSDVLNLLPALLGRDDHDGTFVGAAHWSPVTKGTCSLAFYRN